MLGNEHKESNKTPIKRGSQELKNHKKERDDLEEAKESPALRGNYKSAKEEGSFEFETSESGSEYDASGDAARMDLDQILQQ